MRTEIPPTRPTSGEQSPPDPEVVERARRRRFTAEYRMGILRKADACTQPGQIGALLRREGLYCSHLTKWRRQRDEAAQRGGRAVCGESELERAEQLGDFAVEPVHRDTVHRVDGADADQHWVDRDQLYGDRADRWSGVHLHGGGGERGGRGTGFASI